MDILYLALGAGLIGLVFAVVSARQLMTEDEGDETMRSIGVSIQEGAAAFLKREYTFLTYIMRQYEACPTSIHNLRNMRSNITKSRN